MALYILVILYVISMLYILLLVILHILSIFICRKKTICQNPHCLLRNYCSKAAFTEKEFHEIKKLLSILEDDELNNHKKKPKN